MNLIAYPALQQVLPYHDRPNSEISMLLAASNSSIRTRTTVDTTSANSMELRHSAVSTAPSSLHDTFQHLSELPPFLQDPNFRLYPVDLQPHDPSLSLQNNRTSRSSDISLRLFCTFCHEQGEPKSIKGKSDWKRHEGKFHETGEEYHCPVPGCHEIYNRDKDFYTHLQTSHPGYTNISANANHHLPVKYAYGCGFCRQPICRKPTKNGPKDVWDDRCDHVADCMQKRVEWSFTNTILALLRQPAIHVEWKQVRSYWCQQLGIHHSILEWYPETSRILRQRLEFNEFGPNRNFFLMAAFKLGLQDAKGHLRNFPRMTQPDYTQSATEPVNWDASAYQGIPFVHPFSPHDTSGDVQPLGHNHMDSIGGDINPSKRHSVMMFDANLDVPIQGGFSNPDPLAGNEFGILDPFSVNITPPLSTPPALGHEDVAQDQEKPSPGKRLLRKASRGLLGSKKSQHFIPPFSPNHPDIPSAFVGFTQGGRSRPSQNHNAYGPGYAM